MFINFKLFKKYSVNRFDIIIILFFTTLPFLSLKFFELSFTHYAAMGIIFLNVYEVAFAGKRRRLEFNRFEFLLLAYLLLILLYSLFWQTYIIFAKILFCYLFYVSFQSVIEKSKKEITKSSFVGLSIGMILLVICFLVSLIFFKGELRENHYSLSLFRNFFDFLNIEYIGTFRQTYLLANVYSEVFVLGIYLCLLHKTKLSNYIMFICLAFIVLLKSQRALLNGIVIFSVSYFKIRTKLFLFIIVIASFTSALFLQIILPMRYSMFVEALNKASGFGYLEVGKPCLLFNGEYIYVHNHILSSYFSMGIIGAFISILIFFEIFKTFICLKGHSILLIIPLANFTLGSSFEGVFSIVSWIVLAVVFQRGEEEGISFSKNILVSESK